MVKVSVYADDTATGDKHFCCEGYFTMVGVDDEGRPGLLPVFAPETAEEKAEWEIAAKIKEAMLERRRRAQVQ